MPVPCPQVSADLLKRYKEKFSGGTLSVAWNYLQDSMGTYLAQTNPVTTHREGQGHLRDPQFQLDAFHVSAPREPTTLGKEPRAESTEQLFFVVAWRCCSMSRNGQLRQQAGASQLPVLCSVSNLFLLIQGFLLTRWPASLRRYWGPNVPVYVATSECGLLSPLS